MAFPRILLPAAMIRRRSALDSSQKALVKWLREGGLSSVFFTVLTTDQRKGRSQASAWWMKEPNGGVHGSG
jgi:hypothetical protein